MRESQRLLQLAVTLISVGCARAPAPATAPSPGGGSVGAAATGAGGGANPGKSPRALRLGSDGRTLEPAVPGVPLAIAPTDGPLALKVVYPRPKQLIAVRDSTFLLGAVGSGQASLTINGAQVAVNPNGSFLAWLPVPPRENFRYDLVAALRGDTARTSVDIAFPKPPPSPPVPPALLVIPDLPRFVELQNSNEDAKSDTDAVTILRPTQAGTYKWFLHPRTIVEVTGVRGDWSRVRLDTQLEVWVESKFTRPAERTAQAIRTASNARVTATDQWSDVRIPLSERTPFLIEERRDVLIVTLYGTTSAIDIVNFATNDQLVRNLTWEQVATDRVRLTVHLRQPPFGYLALWERGALVLRVRKPPVVADPARPLAGRVIAVDPGHPPIGSTGPTGLYEGDATLAVGLALKPMLEAAGATVIMTRSAPGAVALGDRAIIARRAAAEVMVSIHLNAHPDGVNPYRTNGSGTYFFHDRAEPLARAVQRGMVRWMGLRDLGVNYDNLAVARPTWFPAILCEGAFVILPDQEAALRTPEFQSRYAIGILEGLEEYFRELSPRPRG